MNNAQILIMTLNQMTPEAIRDNVNYRLRLALIESIRDVYGSELSEKCIMSMKIDIGMNFEDDYPGMFDEIVSSYANMAKNIYKVFKKDFFNHELHLAHAFNDFSLTCD